MSKKEKDTAIGQQPELREIPFCKPARVGNYKIWRSRYKMTIVPTEEQRKKVKQESGGTKKAVSKSYDIEQINISLLDGSWQIKIPATFEMFSLIRDLFAEHTDAADDVRAGQLSAIVGNMFYSSCISNGFFHHAITMLATIYTNPDILSEDNIYHESFMKDVELTKTRFLEWRKEYDENIRANEPTEEEMENDQVAEEMLDELSKEE